MTVPPLFMIAAAFLISLPVESGMWRINYTGTIARELTGQFFVHIPHAMHVS